MVIAADLSIGNWFARVEAHGGCRLGMSSRLHAQFSIVGPGDDLDGIRAYARVPGGSVKFIRVSSPGSGVS